MARVKGGVHAKKKHKRHQGEGQGSLRQPQPHVPWRQRVRHARRPVRFRDRRARKGEMRRLWIQRINAACRQNGTTYSRQPIRPRQTRFSGRLTARLSPAVTEPRFALRSRLDRRGSLLWADD